MRKIILGLLALTGSICCALGLVGCGNKESGSSDYLTFNLLEDGTYEVVSTDIDTLPSEVTIPKTYNGKTVTTIGEKAFYRAENLTKITLPDTITTLNYASFARCVNLTEITLPDSVVTIGDSAFYACDSLADVTIPNSVTTIEDDAFGYCTSLTQIVIPDSVTSIGDCLFEQCGGLTQVTLSKNLTTISYGAFVGCSNLKAITIPEGVTTFEYGAFYNCSSLTEFTVPKSVTSIGEGVFDGCTSIKSISVDADNPNYKSVDGNVYTKDGTTIVQYALGKTDKSFTISSDVTTIGVTAFFSAVNLTQIIIPDSVTCISKWAFTLCSGLTEITISKYVTFIGDYAFAQCNNLTQITVDEDNVAFKSIDGNLYTKDGTLLIQYAIAKTDKIFVVPDCVTKINYDVFDDCDSLTGIVIGTGVTSIGEDVIDLCDNLKSIYYLGTASEWGKIAIDSNNATLDETTIYYYSNSKPTQAGNYWHYDADGETPVVWNVNDEYYYLSFNLLDNDTYEVVCWDVEILPAEITIPKTYNGKTVTTIGEKAFYRAENLKKITLPDTITTLNYASFARCVNLTEITLPESVVTIGSCAFYVCDSLAEVTLSNGLTTIEDDAFGYCTSLTQIVIPDSVTSIGERLFYECSALTQVTLSNNITTISYGAFSKTGLKQFTVPAGVTFIDEAAFYYCTDLQTITIPKGVTTLGDFVLWDCFSLTEIIVDAENPNFKAVDGNLYSKDGTTIIQYALGKAEKSFTIPDGVTTIGISAFESSSLTQIVIPESVTYITKWAFLECTGLTEITIPKNVTFIGDYALAKCSSLTQITVDEDNANYKSIDGNLYTKDGTTIIQYAIAKTDKIFVVPEFVTKINYDVFDDCDSLTGVVIGTGVASIGVDAFYQCENLKSFYYLGSASEWEKIEIDSSNQTIDEATVYYYSSTQPTEEGNYWHYSTDGVTPVEW